MKIPPVSIDELHQVLGTLNLECVICHHPIDRSDFENGKVFAMTGPKRATAAHAAHFYDEATQQQTPSYQHNLRKLAWTYAVQNDPPLKSGGSQ